MLEFRDVWEKDGCVCSRERREKGRKDKKKPFFFFFFNSTGIILRENILCLSYSSSSSLESYCSKSQKNLEKERLLEGFFVWIVTFLEKNRDSLSVGDALTYIFIHFFTHTYIKNTQTIFLKLLYQTLLDIAKSTIQI